MSSQAPFGDGDVPPTGSSEPRLGGDAEPCPRRLSAAAGAGRQLASEGSGVVSRIEGADLRCTKGYLAECQLWTDGPPPPPPDRGRPCERQFSLHIRFVQERRGEMAPGADRYGSAIKVVPEEPVDVALDPPNKRAQGRPLGAQPRTARSSLSSSGSTPRSSRAWWQRSRPRRAEPRSPGPDVLRWPAGARSPSRHRSRWPEWPAGAPDQRRR